MEEKYYSDAFLEMETEGIRSGLWAKMLAENEFDEYRARAAYLRHRAEELRRASIEESRHMRTVLKKRGKEDDRARRRQAKEDAKVAATQIQEQYQKKANRWGVLTGMVVGLGVSFSMSGSGATDSNAVLFGVLWGLLTLVVVAVFVNVIGMLFGAVRRAKG